MAFNSILVGRFGRALARTFRMQVGSPAPQLGAEMVPTWSVGGIADDFDQWFLKDERPWLAGGSQAGDAVQAGVCQIRNPANSGVLALVDMLWVAGNNTTDVFSLNIVVGPADYATAGSARRRDGRLSALQGPVCQVTHGLDTIVAAGARFRQSSTFELIPAKIILPPTFAIQIYAETINQRIVYSFWWREKELPPEQA